MYEFDLGNTFNYAEMAALIAPRPFMVERGHTDGVGLDEYVAFEYAKVRRLYAKSGSGRPHRASSSSRGAHEIHGQGTYCVFAAAFGLAGEVKELAGAHQKGSRRTLLRQSRIRTNNSRGKTSPCNHQ